MTHQHDLQLHYLDDPAAPRWEGGPVPYVSSPLLDPYQDLVHGFSTRLGGTSTGEMGTMNTSFHKGDDPEGVRENYRRLGASIGFDPANLVTTCQTHSLTIRQVTGADRGKGYDRPRDYDQVDGLMTNEADLVLAVYGADCIPALVFDPVRHAIGVCHSGWKGTVGNIAGQLVRAMEQAYGCNPKDMIAVLGPHISGPCYEVSQDVAAQFQSAYGLHTGNGSHPSDTCQDRERSQTGASKATENPFQAQLRNAILTPQENGKYRLSIGAACQLNFLLAGLRPDQVSDSQFCTYTHNQLFFSHRRQQGQQGNGVGFLMLKG